MPEPKFEVGQKVNRIEDRETVGATVLAINLDNESEPPVYEIEYEEGGTGWWPEETLEAQEPAPEPPEPKE